MFPALVWVGSISSTIEALEAYLEGSVAPEKPVKAPPRKWQIK